MCLPASPACRRCSTTWRTSGGWRRGCAPASSRACRCGGGTLVTAAPLPACGSFIRTTPWAHALTCGCACIALLQGVQLNGPEDLAHRYPGNLNMSFAYVEGESLIMGLKVRTLLLLSLLSSPSHLSICFRCPEVFSCATSFPPKLLRARGPLRPLGACARAGDCRVERQRVHQRLARAVLRAARAGRGGGHGAHQHPVSTRRLARRAALWPCRRRIHTWCCPQRHLARLSCTSWRGGAVCRRAAQVRHWAIHHRGRGGPRH